MISKSSRWFGGLSAAAVLATALSVPALAAASPAPAAKPGPVAFSDGMNWIEMNPDGSDGGGRHIVTPTGGGYNPTDLIQDVAVSRDGTRAVFSDITTGRLWTANADGTGAAPLTAPTGGAVDLGERISPDGQQVYFSRCSSQMYCNTYVLMKVPMAGGPAMPVLTTPDPGGDGSAALSPDGTELAYEADTAAGPVVVIADAKTMQTLHTIPGAGAPAFSPDGKTLAVGDVSTSGPGFAAGITLYTAPGAAKLRSLMSLTSDVIPAFGWSPDGTAIAFADMVTGPQGSNTLRVLNIATGAVTTPDANPYDAELYISSVSWTPGAMYTGPVTKPSHFANHGIVRRFGGHDRIETAVSIAESRYTAAPATIAVLSRDDSFADALAGNALAVQKKGPLLLTPTAGLDPRVADALVRTLPHGASVYLLGGEQALGPAISADVAALGFNPVRLAGSDRFATAVRVAAEISPAPHTVMVATGAGYSDALAAGVAAAQDPAGGVVVLSDGAALPPATADYLKAHASGATVYGVGGPGVTAVRRIAPGAVSLTGADRFGTALAVANSPLFGLSPSGFALATGLSWPDALSGGADAGTAHYPLLLSDGDALPADTAAMFRSRSGGKVALLVYGGPNAVPDTVVGQAADALFTPGNWVAVP